MAVLLYSNITKGINQGHQKPTEMSFETELANRPSAVSPTLSQCEVQVLQISLNFNISLLIHWWEMFSSNACFCAHL